MMTNDDVMAALRSDTPLNRARQAFSSACGQIEQAGQQRTPLGPIEMRAMEFEAVRKIAATLGFEPMTEALADRVEEYRLIMDLTTTEAAIGRLIEAALADQKLPVQHQLGYHLEQVIWQSVPPGTRMTAKEVMTRAAHATPEQKQAARDSLRAFAEKMRKIPLETTP